MTHIYHIDAGHGWLEVSLGDMQRCMLLPWDFTEFSYYRDSDRTFFLEEDVDMTTYLYAYHRVFGKYPTIKERHHQGNAYIRMYPHNPMPRARYAA